jgi:molybdopterin-guanine dinucleotide biosynthesis protein A
MSLRVGSIVAGIFVGGASSRMGRPKGLLPYEGVTLVGRWRAMFTAMQIEHVLVGRRPEYAQIDLPALADDPPGVGPIGGLAALLSFAGDRRAIAVACDMPYVTRADIEALIETNATAAARGDRWEPLCAIYEPRACSMVRDRIARGEHALYAVLDALDAVPITIDGAHLRDWDRPSDLSG